MSRQLMIGGVAAAAVALGAGYFGGVFSPADQHANAQAVVANATISAAPLADVTVTPEGRAMGDIILGDPNAPVTIVEYASITCPHCANFHTQSFPAINADYIEKGLAKLVVREVYFDYEGLMASAVARCGGPDKFHKFLDVFFKQQSQWRAGGDRPEVLRRIRRIGLLGGLTPERVDACMADEDYHRALAETYEKTSTADEVRSTPFFLVNGDRVRGAVSADEMAQTIEAHLPN